MTTLPQTSQVRLPRPVGGAVPVIATAAAHAPQGQSGAGGGMTVADVWRVIRANAWLIVCMLLVSVIAGYFVNTALQKYSSRYTAQGLVSIQASTTWNPLTHANEAIGDYSGLSIEQRTQAMLIKNDALFTKVLQNPGSPIRNTSWFHSFEVPVRQADGSIKPMLDLASAKTSLNEAFSANPIELTKFVQVSMTYSIPKDARDILIAIVNQHLDMQGEMVTQKQIDRSNVLNQERSRQRNHIKELEDTQHQKALELNIDGSGATSKFNTRDSELARLIGQQLEIDSELSATNTQFNVVEDLINKGQDPPQVEDRVNNDSQVVNYQSEISQLEVSMKANFRTMPDSVQMKEQLALKEAYEDKLQEAQSTARVNARNTLISTLQTQRTLLSEQKDSLGKRIQTIRDELGELSVDMSDYLTLTDELNRARAELAQTQLQIDALASQMQQSANGVQWAQTPIIPDVPSFPILTKTMTAAVVLGLALSLGIAFLREFMDTTVRSPRDIARIGNLSLLGMIPHEDDDPQSVGVPLPVAIYMAPTSIMAEGFRQVRTRLQHAASLDTTRSILVTSPSPGDGKSVVASNLAAGLALNGRRILLVDANFRRPAVDKNFSVDNSAGFADVLAALDRFDSVVHRTQVPNLDVMPTGPRPANPTELLESQALLDFIERALEEYDHVVFDSGPILLVSETAALAPRVDGVVTVVRARTNTRGLLQRMRDSLRQVKAEHLGVVLNAVRSQGGGYYGRNIKTYYEYQNVDGN